MAIRKKKNEMRTFKFSKPTKFYTSFKNRNEKKKLAKHHRNSTDKKRVRFAPSTKKRSMPRYSVSPKESETTYSIASSHTEIAEKSPGAWENIVLYYLKKLKNLWSNDEALAQKEAIKSRDKKSSPFAGSKCKYPRPENMEKTDPQTPVAESVDNLTKEKLSTERAHRIVSVAIEYGVANGILKKTKDNNFKLYSTPENNKILKPTEQGTKVLKDSKLSKTTIYRKRSNIRDDSTSLSSLDSYDSKRPKKKTKKNMHLKKKFSCKRSQLAINFDSRNGSRANSVTSCVSDQSKLSQFSKILKQSSNDKSPSASKKQKLNDNCICSVCNKKLRF